MILLICVATFSMRSDTQDLRVALSTIFSMRQRHWHGLRQTICLSCHQQYSCLQAIESHCDYHKKNHKNCPKKTFFLSGHPKIFGKKNPTFKIVVEKQSALEKLGLNNGIRKGKEVTTRASIKTFTMSQKKCCNVFVKT